MLEVMMPGALCYRRCHILCRLRRMPNCILRRQPRQAPDAVSQFDRCSTALHITLWAFLQHVPCRVLLICAQTSLRMFHLSALAFLPQAPRPAHNVALDRTTTPLVSLRQRVDLFMQKNECRPERQIPALSWSI